MNPLEESRWLDWIRGMSLDELRRQRTFYARGYGGSSHARKEADRNIREIDREIRSREEIEQNQAPPSNT